MTPSAQIAGGRRVRRWSRETIIEKIREWNDRYGEPPCSADWNPSLARWRAQEWRVERYRDGSWPSTNAAKRPFGGQLRRRDLARPASSRTGPGRAGGPRARRVPTCRSASRRGRAASTSSWLTRARACARRKPARPRSSAGCACPSAAPSAPSGRRATRAGARAARGDRVQVAGRRVRELVAERVEELAADAEARVRAAADQSEAAAREVTEARRAQQLAEARAADAEVRAEAAEWRAEAARAQVAGNGDGSAWTAVRAADERAAAAERRARELATLLCGEARRLTPAELHELRAGGPSGPAVLGRRPEGARACPRRRGRACARRGAERARLGRDQMARPALKPPSGQMFGSAREHPRWFDVCLRLMPAAARFRCNHGQIQEFEVTGSKASPEASRERRRKNPPRRPRF